MLTDCHNILGTKNGPGASQAEARTSVRTEQ